MPEDFGRPAARHFAGMVEPLGLALADDAASDLFPSPEDAAAARAFLTGLKPGTRLVAIHPGSGSETKNWPVESWAELGRRLAARQPDVDAAAHRRRGRCGAGAIYVEAWKDLPHLRARWLPLPILAALLREAALFLGHDSGITHLAAASRRDLPVIALFGPTDPAVWAPPRPGVRVLQRRSGLEGSRRGGSFSGGDFILNRACDPSADRGMAPAIGSNLAEPYARRSTD